MMASAMAGRKTLTEINEEDYDAHMTMNVKGPLFLTQLASPHMIAGIQHFHRFRSVFENADCTPLKVAASSSSPLLLPHSPWFLPLFSSTLPPRVQSSKSTASLRRNSVPEASPSTPYLLDPLTRNCLELGRQNNRSSSLKDYTHRRG